MWKGCGSGAIRGSEHTPSSGSTLGTEAREGAQDTWTPGGIWAEFRQHREISWPCPPLGPGTYLLLHSGCAEMGLLVASHGGSDGCGSDASWTEMAANLSPGRGKLMLDVCPMATAEATPPSS